MPKSIIKSESSEESLANNDKSINELYSKHFTPHEDAIRESSDNSFVIYSPFDYSISQKFTNTTGG